MQITYTLEDGYIGGNSRPHHINVSDEDLEDMSEGEKEEYINELIEEDFRQSVYPIWDRSQLKTTHQ